MNARLSGSSSKWGAFLDRARDAWDRSRRPLLEEPLRPDWQVLGHDPYPAEERRRLLAERGYELSGPWIAGTVDEVAEQLAPFRDAGLARVMCQHMLHGDVDMVALIGEDLAPML